MLSKENLIYILFRLDTITLCDDNYLPAVSNWRDHKSNGSTNGQGKKEYV